MTAPPSTPTPKAKRTDADIIARLIPRADITFATNRSTEDRIDCYDITSQSDRATSHRASFTHHTRAYWCDCRGFAEYHYCRHTDSLAYYAHLDRARTCYRHWDTARLVEEDAQLRGVIADMGSLGWPGMAELDALGDELAARMGEGVAA